jgi:hypothetical protein
VKLSLRTLVGCAALAALCAAVGTSAATTPDLPAPSYKKAAEADLKFVQTRAADLAKKAAGGEKVPDGQSKPAVGAALLLAAYAEVLGDAALKGDALKVAEALQKKDFKAGAELAAKLALKPGSGKVGPLAKPFKDATQLEIVMQPYRVAIGGGLNIEKDIRDAIKKDNPAKLDPAAVEILAVRTAVLNAYSFHVPNDKASIKADSKKLWEKYSTESVGLAKDLAAEAAKGAKADEKKMRALLSGIDGRCKECHNKFRDDE